MRYELANLGDGVKRHAVYDMPTLDSNDYWKNVTDVPCPICWSSAYHGPHGMIRWSEAGLVPGSRHCDGCGRFFQARRKKSFPMLNAQLMRDRRFDR